MCGYFCSICLQNVGKAVSEGLRSHVAALRTVESGQKRHHVKIVFSIAHNIWDPHFTNSTSTPYSHTIITTILIAYSGIYNQLYTSGFNTINQIYKTTFTSSWLAVISILLAKIHINTHSELLHKLATHASQIPSFFQLLYFLDVGISSVNIRFNFHTGHLLDITIPAKSTYLIRA